VRAIGAVMPALMAAATVLTANHYVLDVLAGAALGLLGWVVAGWLERRRVRRAQPPPEVAPSLTEVAPSLSEVAPSLSEQGVPPRRRAGDLLPAVRHEDNALRRAAGLRDACERAADRRCGRC